MAAPISTEDVMLNTKEEGQTQGVCQEDTETQSTMAESRMTPRSAAPWKDVR